MNFLVSGVLDVFMKGVELAFHSFQIDVAYILVFEQIDNDLFYWRRYLAFAIDLGDHVFTLSLKSLLVIL